jgi:TPR repeat protein
MARSPEARASGHRSRPDTAATCVIAIALGVTVLTGGACKGKHDGASLEEGTLPAAAQSSVEVINVIGTCDDVPLCTKECEAGQGDRCRRLGATLQFAKPPDRDEARATSFYEEACKLGNAPGCVSAGQMFEYEHGVTKDVAKAAGYYAKACDVGYQVGCANYAIMLENGRGVPKDLEKAATLYEAACRAGAGLACERRKALRAGDAAP